MSQKAHLHSYLKQSLSSVTYKKQKTLNNGLCLSAKASFQTDPVTMSSMKRKRNVVTSETKFEIIDQLEIGASGSSLAVRYNNGIIIIGLYAKSII